MIPWVHACLISIRAGRQGETEGAAPAVPLLRPDSSAMTLDDVLSFNLVGHIGYATACLSLLSPAALAGGIFYVLHHMVVITTLFLVSGVFLRLRRTTDVARLGGLYRTQPVFAVMAMVPIFSLAGVPPLSGFLGKLAIVKGTFDAGA